ncbi:hypothetical protein PGT21_029456 [Puccinia graminis f. sp. tritici]|uniref:Golgi to ER traffic-protein n=1 Tax=Puccinia graminis f. sp. tritici TaxID=56615 RepID=A0A5B0NX04_PUCGR|nr:hypothetical protein PGT21_029456 [Puccinia graminis f. sp. tritici]
MVSSKEDTQTPEIGQSGLSPTKNSSPTLANQNTSDSPLIHSTPGSAISCNGANEEKHGGILFFQPLGGQLEYLENSSHPEGSPEPSPYPCAQALPEIHSTGPESTNQYLKSPNQEPVELALTLTPTNPEEAPSGRLPPWLRVPQPHPEQQTLWDFSNLSPSISQAGETPTAPNLATPTTPTSPKSPQHNVTHDNTLDTSNIPFESTKIGVNSESPEKLPDHPTSYSTPHSCVTPKSLASHPNRLAAQQLYESRKETRKIQQAKKLGVEAILLDPYDLYSDPVWLGDILAEARRPLSLELHSSLTNQKQVLVELIGNTRMEFGWYAKEMLDTIASTILQTLNAKEESHNPQNLLFIDGGRWSLLQDAMADLKQFGAILRQCPRLLQISQAHPYFNNQHLKMDIISKPIDIKLGGDFRSGSWFSLNLLTCGSSTSSWPDPKSDFARRMENSINRLIQIGGDSGRAVHNNVKPSKPSESQKEKDKESNGRSAAKDYLLLKLTAMGACMKATSETSHHEGLPYLLQKIFEMFLGIVMIHEGYSIIDLEKKGSPQCPKANNKRGGAMVRDTLKLGYRIAQTNNETDGNEEKPEAWTELKQRSIGVLVLFLTFGVQGWFGCFQNRKKYTYRDIYSLMTMAHDMASNGISILSPSAEGIHNPWYNLNKFLAETLSSVGIGSERIDWYQALAVWDSNLDEASVANFFLLDLFQEIRFPGQSLCLSKLKVPPNLTTETVKASWVDLINNVCIPISDSSGVIKHFHPPSALEGI